MCFCSYCPRNYIVTCTLQPVDKDLLSLHYLLPAEHIENKKTKTNIVILACYGGL